MTTNEIIVIIASSFASAFSVWGLIAANIGKYKERIDTLVRDVKDIKSTLQNFGQRIASLEGACGINEYNRLVQSRSPLTLTEEGKEVLAESGGKAFVDENKDLLFKEIDSKEPTTAFDVQTISYDIIHSYLQTKKTVNLKKFAYKRPMKIDLICEVCGLYLRDCYLENHPEIKE